jgi:hypothetical protein
MKVLRTLTPEELERAVEKLRHPPPGSRIEAAQQYGVDLTLLIEQLRLSPAERARRMESLGREMQAARGAARRPKR